MGNKGRRTKEQGISLTENEDNEIEKLTVRDYFIKYLYSDAILYGMSYDEFWNKDPELFFSYRFSYLKGLKIKREEMNYSSWLNGLYNYRAYAVALHNAFDGKNNPMEYFKKPIDFDNEEDKQSKKQKEEETFNQKKRFWSHFKEIYYKNRRE